MKSTMSSRKPSISAACLSLAASVAALAALVSLHILSPEFDPSWRVVSEYALGHYGWVLAIMFLAWAISSRALAFAIGHELTTITGRVALVFLFSAGAGEALAAFFDLRHPLFHGLAAAFSVPELPIAAMLISIILGRMPLWSRAKRLLLWTANLTWISFALLAFAMVSLTRKVGSLRLLIGWPNRLLVVLYIAWAIAVAWQAVSVSNVSISAGSQ